MAVRKLRNGKWVADVTVGSRLDGSRDRRQHIFKTQKEAKREEARLLMIKEHNRGRSYGGITFDDFVADYFWDQRPGLRTSTIAGYKRDIKLRLSPAFGSMAMRDITRYDIQHMISACPTRKTATNARETLSSIMGLAKEMEIIPNNPAGYRYQYPPRNKKTDPEEQGEWLTTWDEIFDVLDYLAEHAPGTPLHRACVLGFGFGLRKGEMVALEAPNVFTKEKFIYINETMTSGVGGAKRYDPKTPNSIRSIPIIDYVAPWMEKWAAEGGPIIKGYDGNAMKPATLKRHFQRMFQSGRTFDDGRPLPKITAFSTRHSFGTACANAGVELTKLCSWMGHVDSSVTKKYYIKQKLKNLYTDAELINDLQRKRA